MKRSLVTILILAIQGGVLGGLGFHPATIPYWVITVTTVVYALAFKWMKD